MVRVASIKPEEKFGAIFVASVYFKFDASPLLIGFGANVVSPM